MKWWNGGDENISDNDDNNKVGDTHNDINNTCNDNGMVNIKKGEKIPAILLSNSTFLLR